ncbi:MAG: 3-methyl-2-oxobutanoate hydroxymethyltransferase [Salinirussus sp.]
MPTVRDALEGDDPITMLTAYDYQMARIVEAAGIDIALVGDSLGTAVLGHDSTLPVTVDDVTRCTEAVVRGVDDTLVIADLPFLSVGVSEPETVRTAGRMLKEAGANAVKLESGSHTVEVTERLVELGIPVQAHLGLTPQRVNQLGLERQGTDEETAEEILRLAREHEAAGAFSLVLEHVPANLAAAVTEAVGIPTIGIGAGPETDGQVLVFTDAVGLTQQTPPFAESFGDVRSEMADAVAAYREAVTSGEFPAEDHSSVQEDLDLDPDLDQ